MNQGVEILLSRMDSNPEEFIGHEGKWDWIMDGINRRVAGKDKDVLAYLTDEEARVLYDKMQILARANFTRSVLETLLPENETPNKAGSSIRYSGFGSDIEIPYIPIKTKGRYIK